MLFLSSDVPSTQYLMVKSTFSIREEKCFKRTHIASVSYYIILYESALSASLPSSTSNVIFLKFFRRMSFNVFKLVVTMEKKSAFILKS